MMGLEMQGRIVWKDVQENQVSVNGVEKEESAAEKA